MVRVRETAAAAFMTQSRFVSDGLHRLPAEAFARESVLPGWDLRSLTGHLVLIQRGLLDALGRPSRERPIPLAEYVQSYRAQATAISELTAATAGAASGQALLEQFDAAIVALGVELDPERSQPVVVSAPRGPISLDDFLASRIIEIVVHADDVNRSESDADLIPLHRGALARCSRALAAILANRYPGRSVEVRIPPYAAVQCAIGDPGPTHTRGTPPNVVETDALTFLRLATGRTDWTAIMASGRIQASGLRADLSGVLPLF